MDWSNNIGIFGGDKRQVYIALSLLNKGFFVYSYRLVDKIVHKNHYPAKGLFELTKKCKVLIGSIPLTKDFVSVSSDTTDFSGGKTIADYLDNSQILIGGVIPPEIQEICKAKGVLCYDLMKSDKIAVMNAIATAEGAIMEAIKSSGRNLHQSKCLVLGYGRCGKVLASKLKGLDAYVTVAARNEIDLAYAQAAGYSAVFLNNMKDTLSSFHFIFNTIPSLILNQEHLEAVSPDVVIIDIASAPGGVDFEYAMNHGINAKLCLGLPGKVAPRASADILMTEIEALLKKEVV